MKILITGNSGYIGSHLSKLLVDSTDFEVHGLDKQPATIDLDRQWAQDISLDTPWNFDEEYDAVIHLAAEVSVGESVKNPELYYKTNIFGTLNVLKKIKTKSFICASTGAAVQMESPYGISKRAMEDIVKEFCTNNNIPYTIFRFYNVVGSDGIPPTNIDGLFYNLIKAKDTNNFNLYGNDYNTKDGSCVRDYIHVNEVCQALISAIDSPSYQIENLGHGVGTTVTEMINTFKLVNNCQFEVTICPRRPGDIEASVLDNPSKYMQKLYTLEDLLRI